MSVAVMLAIDMTGSMQEIHRYLGAKLSEIAQMFEAEGMPVEFAAVGFRDYKDPKKGEYGREWIDIIDFEDGRSHGSAVSVLESWLNDITCGGGGSNYGESSIAAVLEGARELTWPDVKRRVVAVFTDDGPHVPDYGVESWEDARRQIEVHQIDQIHLFTTRWKVDKYDDLDGLGYEVIRHELAERQLIGVDDKALEEAVREFVRMSSEGGFDMDSTTIVRDTTTNPFAEANPFDSAKDEEDDEDDWDIG